MDRKIEDISEMELKAIAYDLLAQINANQNQLNMINNELVRRAKQRQEAPQQVPSPEIIPRETFVPTQSPPL